MVDTVTITIVVAGEEAEVQKTILGPVPEVHITRAGSILNLDPEAHIILAGIDQDPGVHTTMIAEGGLAAGAGEEGTESPTVTPGVGQGHMKDREIHQQKGQSRTAGHHHQHVTKEKYLHARVAVFHRVESDILQYILETVMTKAIKNDLSDWNKHRIQTDVVFLFVQHCYVSVCD